MIYIVICYLLLPGSYKITNKFCNTKCKEIVFLLILCVAFCVVEIVTGIESAWINCFLMGYFMNRLVRLYNVKYLQLLIIVAPLTILSNFYRISGWVENETVIAYSKVFLLFPYS